MHKIAFYLLGIFFLISCKKTYQPIQSPSGNGNYNVFNIINTQNSNLPSDSIRDLFVNGQKLFVCTSNGLAVFENNNWQVYNTSNSGLTTNDITCCWATDSVWWIGSKNGLMKYNTSTQQWKFWNTFNSPLPSNKIRSLCLDKNNYLWIGTFSGGGLARFDGNTWQIYTPSNSPLPSNSVSKIFCTDSIYWIASGGGLSKFNSIQWKNYNPGNSGLNNAWVYDIIQGTNANEIWIATNNGINLYNYINDIWQSFNASNSGLSSDFTRSLYYDSNKNILFVATDGNGLFLYYLTTGKWLHYEYPPYNIPSNFLKDIVPFQNQIWIATSDKGIAVLK
ncbi:MAG: two-component regulator propeller domain-containing protein [Bacteroidota bacterium]